MAIAVVLFVFLAIVVVEVWAGFLVFVQRDHRNWLGISYLLVVLLAFIATIITTAFYSYYANPNTRVFGWPIPRVVFQRDTPTSPWFDYVGPTIVLAYPINFVVYMVIPSVTAIVLILRYRRQDRKRRRHELESAPDAP